MAFLSYFNKRKQEQGVYISLGDSMVTDDYPGEGRGAAALFYSNAALFYPEFNERDFKTIYPESDFHPFARDGASSGDVLHSQLKELPKDEGRPVIVTLTAGGNDILATHSSAEEILHRLHTIRKILTHKFRNLRFLIGTVYDPTDGVGDLYGRDSDLTRELGILHELNDGIRKMGDSRTRVVDIHSHFLGHGAHAKDPANAHHHPEDPSIWYMLNIEPNARGAHEIRKLFWQAFRDEIQS